MVSRPLYYQDAPWERDSPERILRRDALSGPTGTEGPELSALGEWVCQRLVGSILKIVAPKTAKAGQPSRSNLPILSKPRPHQCSYLFQAAIFLSFLAIIEIQGFSFLVPTNHPILRMRERELSGPTGANRLSRIHSFEVFCIGKISK